jgi:mono/diheme cytochrome c family protein
MKLLLAESPERDFPTGFQQFTASCIACHAREQAPIINLPAWAETHGMFPGYSAP